MTQQGIEQERKSKESQKIKFQDVILPRSKTSVRVFADGHAYIIGESGGKYVKLKDETIWDLHPANADIPISQANQKFDSQNQLFEDAWQFLQRNQQQLYCSKRF